MHDENGDDLPPEELLELAQPSAGKERRRIRRRRSGLERRHRDSEEPRTHEERPQTHHHHHRRSHALPWIVLFGVLAAVEAVALILMYAETSLLQQEHRTLAESTGREAQGLAELSTQLPRMREELAALVREHRPELRPLVFDQVIPINAGYAKNILFMVYGIGDVKTHEYQLTLTNPHQTALHAPMNILLFDPSGIEIGRIAVGTSTQGKTLVDLEPGEVRTYSGRVDLQQGLDGIPAYFMLL